MLQSWAIVLLSVFSVVQVVLKQEVFHGAPDGLYSSSTRHGLDHRQCGCGSFGPEVSQIVPATFLAPRRSIHSACSWTLGGWRRSVRCWWSAWRTRRCPWSPWSRLISAGISALGPVPAWLRRLRLSEVISTKWRNSALPFLADLLALLAQLHIVNILFLPSASSLFFGCLRSDAHVLHNEHVRDRQERWMKCSVSFTEAEVVCN